MISANSPALPPYSVHAPKLVPSDVGVHINTPGWGAKRGLANVTLAVLVGHDNSIYHSQPSTIAIQIGFRSKLSVCYVN